MTSKYYYITLLLFGCLFSIHSKIVDPSRIVYKNNIYMSHLNIIYAFDASTLTKDEIKYILNGKKVLVDNSEKIINDDYFIYLKPIWKKKVYIYIPPIISLDQYVSYICKFQIDNDVIRIENSKGSVFYLAADTGISVSKKIVFDHNAILLIIFLILVSAGIFISVYRVTRKSKSI